MKNLNLDLNQRFLLGAFLNLARGPHYRVFGKFADLIQPAEAEEKSVNVQRFGADDDLKNWDVEKAKTLPPVGFEIRDRDAKLILGAIVEQGQFRAVDRFWLDPLRAQLGEEADPE